MSENTHPDRLDMASTDLVQHNIEALAVLFPNCVTETADGKAVDFDLLKQELNHQIIEGNKERYRLEWPGKREAIVTANLPTTKTLRPVREDSVDFDNTENLYIEGDNLEVLKLLQESYFGKIKLIYIDPPYNTGKDFVYKDNFAQDINEFKIDTGLLDAQNQRLVANPETSGRYHSDWLSMIYPRLKLSRNLLTDDGLIFISIDDNEVHNLRKICDEIFGPDNFVGIVTVIVKPEGRRYGHIAKTHEYILVIAKDSNECVLNEITVLGSDYQFYDQQGGFNVKGLRNRNVQAFNSLNRPNLRYPFYIDVANPDENGMFPVSTIEREGFIKVYPSEVNGLKSVWRWGHEKAELEKSKLAAYYGNDGEIRIFQKERKLTQMAKSVWNDKEIISNKGTAELQNLLGKGVFDFPKPINLLRKIIEIAASEDSIILDFFSGAGSTAHAAMQLNSEDGGTRKFIMVQLPEIINKESEAFKAGYRNICEIGKERIRRVGERIKGDLILKKASELDFNHERLANLDTGFRVYRLDESNMQDIYYRPQDYNQEQLEIFADNIKPDRTSDDLLAQVMIDWGLPLSYKIDQLSVSGKQVFQVAQNSLMACFDNTIDEMFAKEVAVYKPMRIVFRDKGFKNDTAKENVRQLLKQLSPETEMRVI
ncbi:site-specific DNA-methyltransferase [Dyadobacter sediminis]|uniref:site-specific DNA-methyltransferase (adenine-specific) n=2 Tax=Dyadobacter sediminis TaxID=1493691 RepID=A0A5R9KL62_9BACT|nr:site-specific DNA-methyltransferase [Dyadobacter sediminis]TLU96961.1 site-specific DNA-methyltransferase [Dyadobacter sediminis]